MISEFAVIYSAMNGGLATSIKFFKTTQALRIKNPTFVLDFLFLAIYSLTEPILVGTMLTYRVTLVILI